jgi:uncharacterized repeat protein (TIGR01451 family)
VSCEDADGNIVPCPAEPDPDITVVESLFTVKAFCQQGVTKTGYLTWVPTDDYPDPPAATNCQPNAENCTMWFGGLPEKTTRKGEVIVDDALCAEFFPEQVVFGTQLAEKQMLLVQQPYTAACVNATTPNLDSPGDVAAGKTVHVECNSDIGQDGGFDSANNDDPSNPGTVLFGGDGFDNTDRGCLEVDGHIHVAEAAETVRFAQATVEVKPDSLNLKCNVDPQTGLVNDNGVFTTFICGAADFDASKVAIYDAAGNFDPDVAPTTQGVKATSGAHAHAPEGTICYGDGYIDTILTGQTCDVDFQGLAQVIVAQNTDVNGLTLDDHDPVTLTVEGVKTTPGETPVVFRGTDDIDVVATQHAPGVADLSLTNTDGESVPVSTTLTYTLTVSNAGPNTAGSGVRVTDTLPADVTVNGGGAGLVTLGGDNPDDWSCTANDATPQVIDCISSASIAKEAQSAFSFTTDENQASAGATLTNTATVRNDPGTLDPDVSNNTAIADTDVTNGP